MPCINSKSLKLFNANFIVQLVLDVFTRNEYKDILIDSLQFCQKEKGMEIFAWCIMTNHVHLIFRSSSGQTPEQLLGDFKRFTSKKIVKAILDNQRESRKDWGHTMKSCDGFVLVSLTVCLSFQHD